MLASCKSTLNITSLFNRNCSNSSSILENLIPFLLFQELSSQTKAISILSVITFVLSIVLCLSLLPGAPEWEALALAGSLLVTISLGVGTLMATHHAPLPLFALILVSNVKNVFFVHWSCVSLKTAEVFLLKFDFFFVALCLSLMKKKVIPIVIFQKVGQGIYKLIYYVNK